MILQEYLPREDAEDWMVHAYFDQDSTRDHMPAKMLLKSTPVASSLDAPLQGRTSPTTATPSASGGW